MRLWWRQCNFATLIRPLSVCCFAATTNAPPPSLQKYRKTCCVCGEFISGSYYTTKDDKFICAKDYKVNNPHYQLVQFLLAMTHYCFEAKCQ